MNQDGPADLRVFLRALQAYALFSVVVPRGELFHIMVRLASHAKYQLGPTGLLLCRDMSWTVVSDRYDLTTAFPN